MLVAIGFSFFAFGTFAAAQGLTVKPLPANHTTVHFAPQWPDFLLQEQAQSNILIKAPSGMFLPNPIDHFAFFCRLELKIENTTKFPIKFRLGDVEYVDRLEGKRD